MNKVHRLISVILCAAMLPVISGCWNYTEVDDMTIVAGAAFDKNKADGKLELTVETINIQGGLQQTQSGFRMLSLSGDTIFDIVRNMISLTGKKLFWSHSKLLIFSEEIAREGLIKTMDWYSRDTETRSDAYIFVSNDRSAHEVLGLKSTSETILSFDLAQMMRAERFTSNAPVVDIWDFIDKLESNGESAVAPLVYIYEKNGEKKVRVNGTAVFYKDKMVGKLNGKETKSMLFAKNKIKGGVLMVNNEQGTPEYSLEILGNQTKVKPSLVDGKIHIQLHTVTRSGLEEVMKTSGFSGNRSIAEIEKLASDALQKDILSVIHKVQQEFHADIFGFGELVHQNLPKAWNTMEENWTDEFNRLDVDVSSKVIIESTAKTTRAIQQSD